MKRKIYSFFILVFITIASFGQKAHCGTTEYYEKEFHDHPEKKAIHDHIMDRIYDLSKHYKTSSTSITIIPVVVHLIGDDVISDLLSNNHSRVNDQIRILNEDYRKIAGTPGAGAGVDCSIEFCLASIDGNGDSTDGMTYSTGTYGNWDMSTTDNANLKALSHWDPTQYLNLYVVDAVTLGTTYLIGIATFPSGLTSSPDLDGVVIREDAFGVTYDQTHGYGGTATHEIGHWLGLHHTWGDNNDTTVCGDDLVNDTPICSGPNDVGRAAYNCLPPEIHQCTAENTAAGLTDVRQVQNYMDYSDDQCANMFTAGQSAVIQSTLFLIRTNLTSNTVCHAVSISNHCYNGIQDADETGIDCGGVDCIACSGNGSGGSTDPCHDGVQDGDETGIDCGGSCGNQCPPPAHCFNGVKDGDETGIDCGGSCSPTCQHVDICSSDNPFPVKEICFQLHDTTVDAPTSHVWDYNGFHCGSHTIWPSGYEEIRSQSIWISNIRAHDQSEEHYIAKDYIDIKPEDSCATGFVDVSLGAFFEAKIDTFSCVPNYSAYADSACWVSRETGNHGNVPFGTKPARVDQISSNVKSSISITIFPNPASVQINFTTINISGPITAYIYDNIGNILINQEFETTTLNGIDISNFPSGFYNIKIVSSKGQAIRNFIKL